MKRQLLLPIGHFIHESSHSQTSYYLDSTQGLAYVSINEETGLVLFSENDILNNLNNGGGYENSKK